MLKMNKMESLGGVKYNKVPIKEPVPVNEEYLRKYGYGIRHIQAIILLLCLTVNIIGRVHMGVTIVAMTSNAAADANITAIKSKETGKRLTFNKSNTIQEKNIKEVIEERKIIFDWPKPVQEMVLNAFFLGYAIMMFPMGLICQRFGGKLPLQIGLATNAVVSILTPWLVTWGGWKTLCFCRILQGLSQTGTFPGIQAILAKWLPVSELGTLSSFVYTGLTVGSVVAFQTSGLLGASRWGWPSIFYFVGVLSLICFTILTVFGNSSPQENKYVTKQEYAFIRREAKEVNKTKLKTPWRAIFTSKAVWGSIATHIGSNVSLVFFFNQVPSYIHYVLGSNILNSGLLTSLPYVASTFTSLAFGWISDYLTNNNIMSKKNCRRTFNSIAQFGISLCLVLTSYTSNITVAVTFLVVAMATNMGVHVGYMVNHIDLSPNFSGTLMANGNTISIFIVVLTPVIVSYVITDTTNLIQWRIMFFIIAGLTIALNMFFVVWVDTDIQSWNYPPENKLCKVSQTTSNEEDVEDKRSKQ